MTCGASFVRDPKPYSWQSGSSVAQVGAVVAHAGFVGQASGSHVLLQAPRTRAWVSRWSTGQPSGLSVVGRDGVCDRAPSALDDLEGLTCRQWKPATK